LTVADLYAASGEFVDVLSGPAWEVLRGPIRTALRGARPDQGPLVDIGAGTGLGTLVLADTFPTAQVVAVEPSPGLRGVLLSRVAADDGLRERVTVMPGDALGVSLPAPLGGALAANMIGHLAPDDRRKLWRRVAQRLSPGAPFVVNLQPPATSVAVPFTDFAAIRIGQYVYEGGGSAEPAGPSAVTWRMRYRIRGGDGHVLHEQTVEYPWHVVSAPDLLAELAGAGLVAEVDDLDVVRAVVAV
jgi:hypothetical protein